MRTREEAEALHIVPWPTNPNKQRRWSSHDYAESGTYLVTLVTEPRRPFFGRLEGSPTPHIELSELGQRIATEELPKIHDTYPNVWITHSVIMPDHLHLILWVMEKFDGKKQLGTVVNGFKTGCRRAFMDVMHTYGVVFEKGYNDSILHIDGQLERWRNYLDDNPRRLWEKKQHPDLFMVMHEMPIAGYLCEAIGNIFLLEYPYRMPVIYHRYYNESEWQGLRRQYWECGENGGVLVSASIHPLEKEVMKAAQERGHKLIVLKDNGFSDFYKPAGRAFDGCAQGRLLQVSPWKHYTQRLTITRDKCLLLNQMAIDICK